MANAASLGLLLREAARVVVPLACAGCGQAEEVVCAACRQNWAPHRLDPDAPALGADLPVWGVGHYEGPLRHTLLAWKAGGRRDVEPFLTAALQEATAALLATVDPDRRRRGILVVPAPSGVTRPLRGRPSVTRLALPVAATIAAQSGDSAVVRALASRTATGQRGRAGRGRTRGPRVRSRCDLSGERVVLVDDVLTTGGTLSACREAVVTCGGSVLGAVVLAGARVRGRARET